VAEVDPPVIGATVRGRLRLVIQLARTPSPGVSTGGRSSVSTSYRFPIAIIQMMEEMKKMSVTIPTIFFRCTT
jgi:hypothetical protein